MMPTLRAASLRHLLRLPAKLALALIGLTLGVGTIVAVDVATASSQRAFELSLRAVNGAATHQITGGPRGIDERLYAQLRTHAAAAGAPLRFAPLVTGYVTVGERIMQLVGVDPFAAVELADEGRVAAAPDPATDGVEGLRRWFTEPGAVVLSAATAQQLGLAVNSRFDVTLRGVRHCATLIGRIDDADVGAGFDAALLTDLAQAQEWLGAVGHLSRVDVRGAGGAPGPRPPGPRAHPPADLEP